MKEGRRWNQPHGSRLTLGRNKAGRDPKARASEACPCGLWKEGWRPELLGCREEGGCSAWGQVLGRWSLGHQGHQEGKVWQRQHQKRQGKSREGREEREEGGRLKEPRETAAQPYGRKMEEAELGT